MAAVHDSQLITLEQIQLAAEIDENYQALKSIIDTGFPSSKSLVTPNLREYWEVRDRLSSSHGIVLMNHRIVIPHSLRRQVLNNLHSAHQGHTSMTARANQTVYWPGMNASIRLHRTSCRACNEIAPSQSSEPLIMTPPPEWPFQKICADYFDSDGHSYITIVDRFSYWMEIYHFPSSSRSESLVTRLRQLFTSYGVPEEISTDGGPQFSSTTFTTFLKDWGVTHRLSSAGYPQSNGRAELAVKTSKRIIMGNTVRGSLDNNKAARALLQYRNTPIQELGLSPAQILFHRQLRDHMPSFPNNYRLHRTWLNLAKERERKSSKLNDHQHRHTTRTLVPLKVGNPVFIHDQQSTRGSKRWIRTGRIVEALPFRQYRVRMDGSGRVSLRNRKFLKLNQTADNSGTADTQDPINVPDTSSAPDTSDVSNTVNAPIIAETPTVVNRVSRVLRQLQDFNKRGLKE